MHAITVYAALDGKLTVDYPAWMTEREALERVLSHLRQKEVRQHAEIPRFSPC